MAFLAPQLGVRRDGARNLGARQGVRRGELYAVSETPTPYASPLPQYLAEAKRESFLRGADWAIEVLQRFRPGKTVLQPQDIERAARAYAGLPVK